MKAVVYDRYGPPEGLRVEDVPVPEPGAGQVLVDVAATSLNLSDWECLTGTVFVVGGQRAGKWAPDPQPVIEAEIFDPTTSPPTFTGTPPMAFPRQYHSIAVLLPDGRVLCAGGVDPANPTERDQRSMEVFSPPYLDAGPRPVIGAAPGRRELRSGDRGGHTRRR